MNDLIKKNILVVEDEASLRGALKEKLTLEGFVILEAKDGEEGLAMALREHPDLILLDNLMPKMDGITMLQKIREEGEWGKNVKVVMLTNLDKAGKVAADLAKGEVYEYFIKSDSKIEDIVKRVHVILDK
jgi:DNA-binding response OmpR family regulator